MKYGDSDASADADIQTNSLIDHANRCACNLHLVTPLGNSCAHLQRTIHGRSDYWS
jgi:hypothetical protein